MKITVDTRIEVTADITVEQVSAYLRRSGWSMRLGADSYWRTWTRANVPSVDVPLRDGYRDFSRRLRHAIIEIASAEARQPGDVLLDIADGPALATAPACTEISQPADVDGSTERAEAAQGVQDLHVDPGT